MCVCVWGGGGGGGGGVIYTCKCYWWMDDKIHCNAQPNG